MAQQKQTTKHEFKVRLVGMDDFDNLAYVYERDAIPRRKSFFSFPLIEWVSHPQIIMHLAENEKDKVVGFMVIRLVGNEARIDKYCVLKSYVGKGVAKALFDSVAPKCVSYTFTVFLPNVKKGLLNEFKDIGFKVTEAFPGLFGRIGDGLRLEKYVNTVAKPVKRADEEMQPPNVLTFETVRAANEVVQRSTEIKQDEPAESQHSEFDDIYDPENWYK